jgi:hypothetical protein
MAQQRNIEGSHDTSRRICVEKLAVAQLLRKFHALWETEVYYQSVLEILSQ